MKILLVNKYHYVKGGSETYHFGLAKLLESHGHEVIYFAMADEKNLPCKQEKYFVSNVDFNGDISKLQKIKAGFRVLYSFEAKKNISNLIEKERPDVVHINLVHRHITLSIVRAIKKYNIPIVFTIHDLNCVCPNHEMLSNGKICELCLNGKYINCIKNKCVKSSGAKSALAALEAFNYKRMGIYDDIDLFITPSEFYKKKLEESGIIHSKIIHMKNFLPIDTVYSCDNPDMGYLLYFGRISEEKGVLTLVKAVEKLKNSAPLYILGTGPVEDEIKSYIEEHNLNGKIKMLGFKSGDELKKYVSQAKCVILPSEWYENGPYAIMEAMSQGKPVIVSYCGGLPEIVEDGKTGFICKPFDSDDLSRCIDKICALSDDEYKVMSKNAVESALKNFNPDSYAQKLTSLYEDLIKSKTINQSNKYRC